MNDQVTQEKVVLSTWPNQVFLHHGESPRQRYDECGGTTWSARQTHASDIRYVRADLTIEPRIAAPQEKNAGCTVPPGLAGQTPSIVTAACETGQGTAQDEPATPQDGTNAILAAVGYDEAKLRELASTWARDARRSRDSIVAASSWSGITDTVRALLLRAYVEGQEHAGDTHDALVAENARLLEMLALVTSQAAFDKNGPLAVAVSEALAGRQLEMHLAVEKMAVELIPPHAFATLALPETEMNTIWAEALKRSGSRLLAPFFFASMIADRFAAHGTACSEAKA